METTERNSRRWNCSKDDYKAKRRSVATVNDYKAKCPSPCLEKLVMVKGIPMICSKIKLSTSLKQLVIQKSPSLLQLLYLIFQDFYIVSVHTSEVCHMALKLQAGVLKSGIFSIPVVEFNWEGRKPFQVFAKVPNCCIVGSSQV